MSLILSWLYQSIIDYHPSSWLGFKVRTQLNRARNLTLKICDPIVKVKIGSRKLLMPLSHSMPLLVSNNQFYDQVLARLANVLGRSISPVRIIDVGANIGDTVNVIADSAECSFLCIEGNARYFQLLQRNTKEIPSVICVNAIVSDSSVGSFAMQTESGTAFVSDSLRDRIKPSTLDELLANQDLFQNVQILKIDTDGFDFRVLRGSTKILAVQQPILFVEFSPEHYTKIGGDSPDDLFPFLQAHGYEFLMIYDSGGYLMMSKSSRDTADLTQLVHYAKTRGLYYDLLVFHDNHKDLYREFLSLEREVFPFFNRPYLGGCWERTCQR